LSVEWKREVTGSNCGVEGDNKMAHVLVSVRDQMRETGTYNQQAGS